MTYTATHRFTACALLTACLFGIELAVVKTTAFNNHPIPLSIGVLFDCTALTSAIFYGLVARPLRLPVSRTILVALAALRVALFMLPATSSHLNTIWPLLLGLLEGAVLVIMLLRFRRIRQIYVDLRPGHGAQTALYEALSSVFGGKVARIILSEGQVIYYALFNWRKPANLPAGAMAVTTHRESGQLALLTGLLSVALIEATAMHFLLAVWWPTVAVWLTAASLYGCLMILAILNTSCYRPSFCTETALHLRLDMRWEVIIPRSAIAAVTPIFDKPTKQSDLLNAALVTAPNILITLREPLRVQGIYGLGRTVTQISLFVDSRSTILNTLQP